MVKIDARCTQCGHREYGSPSENTNYVTYDVPAEETKHGSGKIHGTETFDCPMCEERTVHNRSGSSVPRGDT